MSGSIEKENTEFIFFLPRLRTQVDEISLCPSLGSKNQVLITVNQTLQITEECGTAPTSGHCTPSFLRASSKGGVSVHFKALAAGFC